MRCDCKKETEKKIDRGVVVSKIAVGFFAVLVVWCGWWYGCGRVLVVAPAP